MSFRNVEKAIVNPISIELDIFADILTLKYEVINEETSDLMEEYSNYENFQEFITTVNNLIGFESVFFMLNDSFIEKILKILNFSTTRFLYRLYLHLTEPTWHDIIQVKNSDAAADNNRVTFHGINGE